MEHTFFNALYAAGSAGCVYLLCTIVARALIQNGMMGDVLKHRLYRMFAPTIAVLGFFAVFVPYAVCAALVLSSLAAAFPAMTAFAFLAAFCFWLGYTFANR